MELLKDISGKNRIPIFWNFFNRKARVWKCLKEHLLNLQVLSSTKAANEELIISTLSDFYFKLISQHYKDEEKFFRSKLHDLGVRVLLTDPLHQFLGIIQYFWTALSLHVLNIAAIDVPETLSEALGALLASLSLVDWPFPLHHKQVLWFYQSWTIN